MKKLLALLVLPALAWAAPLAAYQARNQSLTRLYQVDDDGHFLLAD